MFGDERQSRYVCEENLQVSKTRGEDTYEQLENEGWKWKEEQSLDNNMPYSPPNVIKFKYGESFKEEEQYSTVMYSINDVLLTILKKIGHNNQQYLQENIGNNTELVNMCSKLLSLDNIFVLLKQAENSEDADCIEGF